MKHLEAIQQRLFIKRVRLDPSTKALPLFAIPNGGKRGAREAALMKAEGVLAGVPDLFLAQPQPIPQGSCGLFLEFKSAAGKLSAAQQAMGLRLLANGYTVVVVRSAEEAWHALTEYLASI